MNVRGEHDMRHLHDLIRITALTIFALGIGCFTSSCDHAKDAGGEAAKSAEKEKPDEDKKPDETAPKGVKLSKEVRVRLGLMVEELHAKEFRPETIAYGVLEEDSASIFILRAPLAGIIRGDDATPIPIIGQIVEASTTIGRIEPRLGPVEFLDVESRLTQANAEVTEASAALTNAQLSYESKKKLNENQLVSDRTFEESDLRVKQESARLAAAKQVVSQLEAARSTGGLGIASMPLRVPRAGEVVECNCRNGEAVEAGQVLIKVANYERVIARITVPFGTVIDELSREARIVVVGNEDHPLDAHRVAAGISNTGRLEGRTLLYSVDAQGVAVRPGAGVTAYLPTTAETLSGFIVPRPAVVRYLGRSWVFAQVEEGQYLRRPIDTKYPTAAGWFVDSGFNDGDPIVVTRAAVLLSEEAKAAIEQEAASVE